VAFPDLRDAERAEDFFEALEVPYEQGVMDVFRLQVLKRFAVLREAIDREAGLGDEERTAAYRRALATAHEAFADGAATPVRVLGPGAALVRLPSRGWPG